MDRNLMQGPMVLIGAIRVTWLRIRAETTCGDRLGDVAGHTEP